MSRTGNPAAPLFKEGPVEGASGGGAAGGAEAGPRILPNSTSILLPQAVDSTKFYLDSTFFLHLSRENTYKSHYYVILGPKGSVLKLFK